LVFIILISRVQIQPPQLASGNNSREVVKTELVAAIAHVVEQVTQNHIFKGSNPVASQALKKNRG
jgi:hypothetical protein